MANRHTERCSVLSIIRLMQIKATMRYHFTAVRTAIITKNTNNKCWWGCREKGAFVHCWWEYKLVQLLWKIIWRFLKKLKIELPYDSGYTSEENESTNYTHTHTHTPIFIAGLPCWLSGKELACQRRRPRFDHWVKKIRWRKINEWIKDVVCVCMYGEIGRASCRERV